MHNLIFDYCLTNMKENGKNNNKTEKKKGARKKRSVNRKV